MMKVLDFGLAKALELEVGGDPSQSPTMTAAATRMGVIMGTAAYMSPEQARGKVVDKRGGIWAFGVVLHEMLAGRASRSSPWPSERSSSSTATRPGPGRPGRPAGTSRSPMANGCFSAGPPITSMAGGKESDRPKRVSLNKGLILVARMEILAELCE